jgi:hypothetical protein
MQFAVQTRSRKTKEFIEGILPSLIKQLGLTCSKKLLFIKLAREGLEDNDGLTSYLTQFEAIVILLKPQSFERLGITLAHEMVHVKQLAKGHLKNVKGVNYWNGKRYSKRTKYLNMPWEIEAFSKQELLFRRAID